MSAINLSSVIRVLARRRGCRATPSRIPTERAFWRSCVSLSLLAIWAGILVPAHVEARPLDAPVTTSDCVASPEVFTRQIDDLVPALAIRARSQETLRGVVAEVDQRNDQITVRLTPTATADFKVQDGLLFDFGRYGDEVELTVETIDGKRTIVGLRKE